MEYLTVSEALTAVLAQFATLPTETIPLMDSLNRVLAQSVVAQDNLPPFANSAMDGYALRAEDIAQASPESPTSLSVVADIAAGVTPAVTLTPGTSARIMTGAPMPAGANAVVPVEDTNEPWREKERPLPPTIEIRRSVNPGDYVRPAGKDVTTGQEVLAPGHRIRPQEIAVLAALGLAQVSVVKRPLVGILATGDELIDIDQPLQPGKIRNSNGYAQSAQVLSAGGLPLPLGVARDTEADVRAKLQKGVEAGVNLFVSSAGVSVGAYDVVKTVLETDGDVNFWRVRMRPGKPLAFGTYQNIPYLGLPGNPVSSIVSFERFARPAILKMGGHTQLQRPQLTVTIQEELDSDGRESYIRAIVRQTDQGYQATTTGAQGSNIMTSLTQANALVVIPEGVKRVSAGERLTAVMIDWPETTTL